MEDVLHGEPHFGDDGFLRGLAEVCGEGLDEGVLVVVDEIVQLAHLLLAERQRARGPGSKEGALLGDNLPHTRQSTNASDGEGGRARRLECL